MELNGREQRNRRSRPPDHQRHRSTRDDLLAGFKDAELATGVCVITTSAGDHAITLGDALDVMTTAGAPLVYQQRRFRGVMPTGSRAG